MSELPDISSTLNALSETIRELEDTWNKKGLRAVTADVDGGLSWNLEGKGRLGWQGKPLIECKIQDRITALKSLADLEKKIKHEALEIQDQLEDWMKT